MQHRLLLVFHISEQKLICTFHFYLIAGVSEMGRKLKVFDKYHFKLLNLNSS